MTREKPEPTANQQKQNNRPQRHIPMLLKARLLLLSPEAVIWWLFLLIMIIPNLAAFCDKPAVAAKIEAFQFSGPTEEISATVNVRGYQYRYNNKVYQGRSYPRAIDDTPVGETVLIEVVKSKPWLSRIVGRRTYRADKNWPAMLWLLVLLPLVMLVITISRNSPKVRLLQTGLFADARLLSTRRTRLSSLASIFPENLKPSSNSADDTIKADEFVFEFERDDGRKQVTTMRTQFPRKLKRHVVIYEPKHSNFAMLLDAIPGKPHLDFDSKYEYSGRTLFAIMLILPLLSITSPAWYLLLRIHYGLFIL